MASNSVLATGVASERQVLPLAQRKAVGLVAVFAGLACIFFVGFAPMAAVHNAAHDTRHGAAFPCH